MESLMEGMPKPKLAFTNQHFRVAISREPSPPFYIHDTFTNNQNVTTTLYGGIYVDAVKGLSKVLNFTYEFVFPQSDGYGSCNLTACTGILGLVADGKADFAAFKFDLTDDRYRRMAFGPPFPPMFTKWAFLMKNPPPSIVSNVLAKPFSMNVWITALVSAVVVWLAMSVLGASRHRLTKRPTWVAALWRVLRVAVQQGDESLTSDCYIPLSWVVATFLLLQVYAAMMVSLFSSTTVVLPFTNMAEVTELVASGRARLVQLNIPLQLYINLFEQKGHLHRKLAEALNSSGAINVRTPEELTRLIEETDDTVVFSFDHMIKSTYLKRFSCNFAMVVDEDSDLSAVQGSFIFRKGFPFQEQFNLVLSSMSEAFYTKLLSSYPPYPKQCPKDASEFALSMNHLKDIFFILAGGILVSFVLLAAELCLSILRNGPWVTVATLRAR